MKDFYALSSNNQTVNSENCVTLFGTEIDNTHLTNLFLLFAKFKQSIKYDRKKPELYGLKEKEVLLNSLFYLILITVLLYGISVLQIRWLKEKITTVKLRIPHNNFTSDYTQLLDKSS